MNRKCVRVAQKANFKYFRSHLWKLALLVLVAGTTLSVACNEPIKGCLDIEAENFDVTAEKNDEGLCTFPSLLLNVGYAWADTAFVTGVFYINDHDQMLSIEEFHFLFGQFNVSRTGTDEQLVVEERTDWWLSDENAFTEALDDFTFVDRSRFTFTLGTIVQSGFGESYTFWSSVPDTLTPTEPDSTAAESRIQDARALYDPDLAQFASARFVIDRDTADSPLDTLVVYAEPFVVSHMLQKELRRGFDDTLRIALNLESIFGPIDLTQSNDVIVEQIANSLKGAIVDNN